MDTEQHHRQGIGPAKREALAAGRRSVWPIRAAVLVAEGAVFLLALLVVLVLPGKIDRGAAERGANTVIVAQHAVGLGFVVAMDPDPEVRQSHRHSFDSDHPGCGTTGCTSASAVLYTAAPSLFAPGDGRIGIPATGMATGMSRLPPTRPPRA